MANTIHFELVTLDGTKFGEDVYEIVLPTPDGEIAILPNHIPLVSIASPGVIAVRRRPNDTQSQMALFAVGGGVIEVVEGTVRVLVDAADHAEEINEQEATKAYERAQQLVKDAKNQVELGQAQSLMDRHAVRLKVAGLRRHHKRTQ